MKSGWTRMKLPNEKRINWLTSERGNLVNAQRERERERYKYTVKLLN